MSGPFESLDLPELDESLACVDGVCAVPGMPSAGEGVGEQPLLGLTERDAADGAERLG
ncbi:MAG: hypothetical protein RL238_3357 [Actinomycetota bacterium]|jgi:hypothetical protein